MELKQAIEKRLKVKSSCGKHIHDFTNVGTGDTYMFQFSYKEMMDSDWEVIAEEIAVGDTVESIHCPGQATVIGVNKRFVCYQYMGESGMEINLHSHDNVKLIHKGPRVHRFEGVKWFEGESRMGVDIFWPDSCNGKIINDRVREIVNLSKTYDMTLTERK